MNYDLHYILHGLIILMIALIGGIFFAKAIKRQKGEVAWRVVHSGGSVAGVMLIALGAVINRLTESDLIHTIILWGVVGSTYLLIIGMVVAAVAGERGIGNKENRNSIWKTVYYLYGIGSFFSIVSIATLIIVCVYRMI